MMTLNHGLSGYVCGQVAMPLLRRGAPLPERSLGWAWFLGAMLPDLDIVTRLLLGRGAYFSGTWYGHRGLSHSLAGTLVLGLVAAAVLYRPLVPRSVTRPRAAFAWLAGCAWAGGMLHIFGDLFTPGWQMPVLWPLEHRYGAWRHIGWFSPYLLWLFLTAVVLGLAARRWLPRRPALRVWAPMLSWGVFALAAWRWVDFLARSRYESWAQWSDFQQRLLPEAMITPVVDGVSALWHWFTG